MLDHDELRWMNTFERGYRSALPDLIRINDLRVLLKSAEERMAMLENRPDINEKGILEEKAIINAVRGQIMNKERRFLCAEIDMGDPERAQNHRCTGMISKRPW